MFTEKKGRTTAEPWRVVLRSYACETKAWVALFLVCFCDWHVSWYALLPMLCLLNDLFVMKASLLSSMRSITKHRIVYSKCLRSITVSNSFDLPASDPTSHSSSFGGKRDTRYWCAICETASRQTPGSRAVRSNEYGRQELRTTACPQAH